MMENIQMVNIFEKGSDMNPGYMRTDIQEKEGSYLLEIELAGFAREEIKAELKDGILTIIADRPEHLEKQDDKIHYIRKERYSGGCKRSFYVGEKVEQEDITAAFKDGVLNIIIANNEKMVERDEIKLIPIK